MNALEIKSGERTASVKVLEKNNNQLSISVDDKVYNVDVLKFGDGIYSVINERKSYNVELASGLTAKKYSANIDRERFNLEVIDAESKYLMNRKSGDTDDDSVICSPMPGKVVRILVNVGDHVKAGDTVVIVSAMKMESEYKVKQDRVIKAIKVKEGDTVDSNQPMIIIE